MGISQSLGIESQLYASFSVVSLITLKIIVADLKNSLTELGTRNQSQVYFQPRSIKKWFFKMEFRDFLDDMLRHVMDGNPVKSKQPINKTTENYGLTQSLHRKKTGI